MGVRVLLTRSEADSKQLQSLLEQRGAEVQTLPTLAIEPPEDPAPLADAVRHLRDFDWIAFSSRNAVEAVFRTLEGRPFAQHVKVGAVGSSTAAAIAAHGVEVTCIPKEATGLALAEEMQRTGVRGARVLLPVGDRARPELRRGLEAVGARVHQVVAYRTVYPAVGGGHALEALRRNEIDVVVVASPSAVDGLISMLGSEAECLGQVRWVCIGPTTADAVEAAGFRASAIAGERTATGLADAVTSLYRGEPE